VTSPEASTSRVHLSVFGRVQGVGFRWFTERIASRLELAGWVRNCADGSVELEAEGHADAILAFRRALHEGPPGARVDRVEERVTLTEPLERPFAIRRASR
jgi:acylphosphatase